MQMQVNPRLHATTEPQKRLAWARQGRHVYKKITKKLILYNILGDCSIRLFHNLCGVQLACVMNVAKHLYVSCYVVLHANSMLSYLVCLLRVSSVLVRVP